MDGHDVLTHKCMDMEKAFLSEEVEIKPYCYRAYDQGPYNSSKDGFEDYLGRPYLSRSDEELYLPFFDNKLPRSGRAPAWQILTVYSYEPDFGMDEGLSLSPLQRFMGGSGTWRHEEFHILLRFGEVIDRFLHFDRLSMLANEKRDRYWVLRFAARALHYLEDCGTPYHTSPGSPVEIFKIPFLYRKQFKKISFYHKFHDRYLGYRLWRGYKPFLEEIEGTEAGIFDGLEKMAETIRRRALDLLPETELSLKRLIDGSSFENPSLELSKEYYDKLVSSQDTRRLDEVSCKVLRNLSSGVKFYLNQLERRLN